MDLLTAEQLEGWRAYWRIMPFGHDVDTRQRAQQALLTAVAAGDKDSQFEDFLPRPKPVEDSEEELDDLLVAIPGAIEFAASINHSDPPEKG